MTDQIREETLPMRVVVNQLAALGLKTGIGHYAVELLRCLRDQAGEDQIDGFPQGWLRHVRERCARVRPYLDRGSSVTQPGPPGKRPLLATVRGVVMGGVRRGGRAFLAHYFRALCLKRDYDLYHEPNFIPFPCDCPTIATLHDLSVILHPEWHPADRVAYYEEHFQQALRSCVHFLTVSDFCRQEVIRTLGIPPQRVTRIYNGIRPGLGPLPEREVKAVLHQLDLPPRFLLYVGTIEPRKNVLMLMRAYCSLPESVRTDWPLVLVGSWGWNAGAVAEYLHDVGRSRGVIHVGYLSEDQLAAVYNGARALIYPSLYEGFGLPPVEMMACGGAVLASTAGALVETVGGQAHLLHPDDMDGWRRALARVVSDEDWWQSLRSGARAGVRGYTWERCAAEVLQVYRSVLASRQLPTDEPNEQTGQVLRAAG
jgi:alpha-1,3-rhamnosyl/mannosyltransferase